MPGGPDFLPGIGDYNEFMHRREDAKEAEELARRHKKESEANPSLDNGEDDNKNDDDSEE